VKRRCTAFNGISTTSSWSPPKAALPAFRQQADQPRTTLRSIRIRVAERRAAAVEIVVTVLHEYAHRLARGLLGRREDMALGERPGLTGNRRRSLPLTVVTNGALIDRVPVGAGLCGDRVTPAIWSRIAIASLGLEVGGRGPPPPRPKPWPGRTCRMFATERRDRSLCGERGGVAERTIVTTAATPIMMPSV